MKILHLLYESKGDYFGIGGAGIRAYEIYRYLKERHDITLLCKKYPGARDGEIEDIKHIFFGTESRSLTATLLSYAFHVSRFVRKEDVNYDIIIEDFSPAIPTFLHAFTKKPVALQIQGYTGLYYFRKYNPAYALSLFSLEKLRPLFYKNLIFISGETVKKVLRESYQASGDGTSSIPAGGRSLAGVTISSKMLGLPLFNKIIGIIPNGINPELLDVIPEDGDYILYIGRLDIYGKGLDILLSAYKKFIKSYPEIRLVIAGDGRDRKRFETLLSELPFSVRKNIELTGWVTGRDKTEVLRKALFCVFPSRHEVQGITLLEAMACEKAVIVSRIPELSYVVQEGAGLSFESENALSLAQSMRNLMICNKLKEMGRRGRDWVKDYTWDEVALRFERFLDKVLER